MSGHSKWNNIKNKKEKTDSQKAKVFTKLGREIAIVVKEGGSNPENNSKLRDVIAKAKAANMPNDNIQRSIKKAAGELSNVNYEENIYEGYGPGGVAVIVETLTDNKNRTAGEMRYIFDRNGGSIGASGCVSWMFDRVGTIYINKTEQSDDDAVMMDVLEAGAEDMQIEDDFYKVITDPTNLTAVRDELEKNGYAIEMAEIDRIPQNTVTPLDEDVATVIKLIDALEDNDDVQDVYHNAILEEE